MEENTDWIGLAGTPPLVTSVGVDHCVFIAGHLLVVEQ